ncbi:MAG: sulfotransferase [Acidobacteriia bacterium]|nr:sulfotransferase [Terriglobia bacterium]
MLLGSHPEICTVGELTLSGLHDLDTYRCSCLAPIRECPFWAGVTEEMLRRGFSFDITRAGTDFRSGATPYVRRLLRPLHRGALLEFVRDGALALSPTWRAGCPGVQARIAALVDCLEVRSGKRVIVDSSKVALRLKYLLRNPQLEVRAIRLVRDGRGVALTYTDPARFADAADPRLRGGGAGGNRESERLSMAEAAFEWRRSNQEAEAVLQGVRASDWTQVRYEDLCREPEPVLEKLFRFVGVAPVKALDSFRLLEQHVIGNGMRLDSVREVRLDERWKSSLSADDLAVFDRVAGKMNRSLGYN